jgi:guanylate kinase
MDKGPLIILSGPSGSGKSTVVRRLLASGLPLRLAVSATTRKERVGEQEGVHYHFWKRSRFEQEIAAGAFLEWADVFGNLYGTLRSEVEPYRLRGIGVLLEIDVQGAAAVREKCPDAVSIFLRTSSLATYEQRLRDRGTEDVAAIRRRVAGAERELARAGEYDYQIINDDLETAVAEVLAVVRRQFTEGDGDAG